jgi:site-specific DNA-methyltransferase (adenine-specific)
VGAGGEIMQIVEKSLNELTPYKNNPRKNDNAVDAVAASIKAFGFKVPIVIDKEGVIVCGHTRAKAAKKLKIKTVPCVIADDLTEDEIKAFRLADNKVGELAEWDLPALDVELADIDFDMGEFGFGLLDDDYTKPEEVKEDDFDEEPPAEPKAKRGDIYLLGKHRLMCGDSTSAEDVAKLMDGAKADMVFTDPPYNVAIGSKNAVLNQMDHEKRGHRVETEIAFDKGMSDSEVGEQLWKPAFQNMADNAKDDCSIYVTMPQGGTHMMMMMMMADACWQVKHELMWLKNQPTFSMGRLDYDYKHEPIMYGWKKTHNFYGKGQFTKSVWEIDKPKESKLHPTMKPIALIANALLNSSVEGNNILDLFGGSGSTLIACEQLNRKCYMMELEPKYVDVIIARWENLTGQKAEKI